jgi:multicomponent Na+:H+ antiporter subunit C
MIYPKEAIPMLELIRDNYSYWSIMILLVIGLHGMLAKKNLLKKVISLSIFQSAIILFFIVSAFKWNATVPILDERLGALPEHYVNPLPHTLMLTAIVVGVATVGVALALLISIYRHYRSLDEPAILERMQ